MLLLAFVAFFALLLVWLLAPSGDVKAAPVIEQPLPNLAVSESPA